MEGARRVPAPQQTRPKKCLVGARGLWHKQTCCGRARAKGRARRSLNTFDALLLQARARYTVLGTAAIILSPIPPLFLRPRSVYLLTQFISRQFRFIIEYFPFFFIELFSSVFEIFFSINILLFITVHNDF